MAIDYDYLKKRFPNDELRILINQMREYQITPKDVHYGMGLSRSKLVTPPFDDKVITLTDDHIRFLRGELFDDLEGERQKMSEKSKNSNLLEQIRQIAKDAIQTAEGEDSSLLNGIDGAPAKTILSRMMKAAVSQESPNEVQRLQKQRLELRAATARPPATKPEQKQKSTKRKSKKTWLRKIMLFLLAAFTLWGASGANWQNFLGMICSQALILFLGWKTFRSLKPKKEEEEETSKIRSLFNKLKNFSWASSLNALRRFVRSYRLPLLFSLPTVLYFSLQLIHTADGDPQNHWFRFLSKPNWLEVIAGVVTMLLLFLTVTYINKKVLAERIDPRLAKKLAWLVLVVALVLFLFGIGLGQRLLDQMAVIRPLETF